MKKQLVLILCLIGALFLLPATAKAAETNVSVVLDHYHTYAEIEQIFISLAQGYSDLAKLDIIGQTFQGRNLYVLEVTNFATGSPESKPAMFLAGPHHGNEIIGAEIALYYAWYLLSNYPADTRVKQILDTRTVYIIPEVNPDGHEITLQTDAYQRPNARPMDEDFDGLIDEDPPEDMNGDGKVTMMRILDEKTNQWIEIGWEGYDNDHDGLINEDWIGGVDLNRNYDYNWTSLPPYYPPVYGEYPFSEPETAAVRDFVVSHPNIATGIDFHSGAQLVMYPWGNVRTPAPDFTTFVRLGIDYGKITGYHDEQVSRLFPVNGVSIDWMYGTQGIIYFINEVFGIKWKTGAFASDFAQFSLGYPDVMQPWVDINHPDLPGMRVQLGGMWTFRLYNPPEAEIQSVAFKNVQVALNLAEITPKVKITSTSFELIQQDAQFAIYGITATVQNTGFLATSTEQSILTETAKPVLVEFTTEPQAELIQGSTETSLGTLQGDQAITLNWTLKVYSTSTSITISSVSEKGGADTTSFSLP